MKRILIGLMAILLVVGMLGAGTSAYFSSTVSSTSNDFSTGTLTLKIGNSEAGATDPVSVSTTWHSPSGWAPGQTFESTVYIKNDGTIPATYLGLDWKKPTGDMNITDASGKDLSDYIDVVGMQEFVGGTWNDDLGTSQHYYTLVKDGSLPLTLKELSQSYLIGSNEGVAPASDGTCPNRVPGGQPLQKDDWGNCVRFTTDGITGDAYDITPAGTPAIAAGDTYALKMVFKLDESTPNDFQGKSIQMNIQFTGAQDTSVFP